MSKVNNILLNLIVAASLCVSTCVLLAVSNLGGRDEQEPTDPAVFVVYHEDPYHQYDKYEELPEDVGGTEEIDMHQTPKVVSRMTRREK